MLSALLFIPLAGSVLLLLLPRERPDLIRGFALVVTAIPLALGLALWGSLHDGGAGMSLSEAAEWIPSIGATYHLGLDGMSYPLVLLTGLVSFVSIIASWRVENRAKEFFAWMLVLQTAVYGVFMALDLLLFFVFWEAMLVPMYFIVGIWGGPRREYAAVKFFIYTLTGSAFLILGVLAVYFAVQRLGGPVTFDIPVLIEEVRALTEAGLLSKAFQVGAFALLFIGFAVKVPIFPFHTWLPAAHVEAPTGGSMILAGLLLKTGAYGFFRIAFPILPHGAVVFSAALATLGVINIVYGALCALAQKDLKRMVAYSSISHMGFVLLGLAALAMSSGNVADLLASGRTVLDPDVQAWMTRGSMATNGALFVMVSHGLISPLLFFLVGNVFYEHTHTRMLDEMGGLYNKMPVAGIILAFAAFANLGLPGLSGFVGEFFTLAGTFPSFQALVIIAALGLAIVAAVNLVLIKGVLQGTGKSGEGHPATLADINLRELTVGVPLMVLITLLGIAPGILTAMFNPVAIQLLSRAGGM